MKIKTEREMFEELQSYDLGLKIDDEVDLRTASCLARYICENKSKALLFENIEGYPNHKIVTGLYNDIRKLAIAFDLDPELPFFELYTKIGDLLVKAIDPSKRKKPKEVSDAPCKENIVKEDVDLYKLVPPVVIHGGDGGPKITWHGVVTKDLKTEWTNMGMYRAEIVDKDLITMYFGPGQDIARQFREYEIENKDMPVAIAIGGGNLQMFLAQARVPSYVDEYDVAGGMLGKPIELVKCETSDLLVPAFSEIVIEGRMLANKRLPEGPFGEFTGYRTSERAWRAVIEVDCVTYRNDPWYPISSMGMPVDDSDVCSCVADAATIRHTLESFGVPYQSVYLPFECASQVIIVQAPPVRGIATRIAKAVFAVPKFGQYYTLLIVVPPDVDPTDPWRIIHAIATRSNPAEGKILFYKALSSPLLPIVSPDQRNAEGENTDRIVIDTHWPKRWPFYEVPMPVSWRNEDMYPKEIQEKTKKIAEKYSLNKEV